MPDLLGAPLEITTTTTVATTTIPSSTVVTRQATARPISAKTNAPTGLTLILAAIAWLASLGGLLVYAEDQRSLRWKHLAR